MSAEPHRGIGIAALAAGTVAVGSVLFLLQACFGTREEAPPPSPLSAPQHLSSPEALNPFYAALAALDGKTAERPVRILQIGDSHTANDSFSGRMRDRLQGRFGNAGRGWLPAGIPFKYYRPHSVNVGETGWQHVKPADHAPVALGLDASAAESQPPNASMTIESTDADGFDRFGVEFLTVPNGSAFTVAVDGGAPVRVSTAAANSAIKTFDLPLDRTAHRVELQADARPPAVLLGWDVERQNAGIIYENHGTIGATVGLLSQMTPEAVSFELATRRPALLIVAFGTNEGFEDGLDVDRYAARFEENIEALRHAANGAPVLIIGTPDGNRVARACTATPCQADSGTDDCSWREPPKLAAVRDAQRRVAMRRGWAYWNWFGAMGGTCSIDRMVSAGPPLAMPDHVHLSKPGYEAMADLLYGDLMRGYEQWKAQQPRTS
jgi:lysophospholipase L1-like esterase